MCAFSAETGAVPLCFHKITRLYFPWLKYYLSSSLKETSSVSQHPVSGQVKKALPASISLHAELGLEAPNLTFLLLFGGILFVLHMVMIWQKDLPNVSVRTADDMVPSPFPNSNSSHLVLIFFLPLKLVLFFFTKACFRHLSF